MSDFFSNFVEDPLFKLGLLNSPYKRFGVVTFGTFLILTITKPKGLYYEGKMRPWSVTSDSPHSTPVPVIAVSGLFGIFSILFV